MSAIYNEIKLYARSMHDESTITKRREAARRLEQRLTSARVRQTLAMEAGDNARQAMAEMWRFVIHNVILATDKAAKSRSKLNQQDLLVCFSIIKCCDIPDESLSTEEAKLRGTFRLSRKEVRLVLNFCLSLLEDEDVLETAELDLLDMLAYVAASRGYMSHMKSQEEMQLILRHVEIRILDESLPQNVRQKAAEIFHNLCQTNEDLGLEMTTLFPGCVKLVAQWCNDTYSNTQNEGGGAGAAGRPFSEMSPLIAGITSMLRANPEQAIAPLARHGRAILRLTKSRYRRIADRVQRHVLNEYFLCHLLVAQSAGELKGLPPGELGDLGDASLSPRMVHDLLQLAMNRQGESQSQQQGVEEVDGIQRTQLELTAQLFACAQRQALCKLEHAEMGADPIQFVLDMVDKIPKPDDLVRAADADPIETLAAHPRKVVAETPFMKYVLKGLYQGARDALSLRPTAQATQERTTALPLLKELSAATTSPSKDRKKPDQPAASTKTLLQIVAACAETFPAGSCWASRSMSCWFEIPAAGSRPDHFIRNVHGCHVLDLATVVSIVGAVLDAHGDHNGDIECQKWALRCVIRLAKTTSCLTLLLDKSSEQDVSKLAKAWRDVWVILFRSDLRYTAYTATTTSDSVSEVLLWALSSMIQNICTDPQLRWSHDLRERRSTWLYRHQTELWKLPVFSLVGDTASLAPFDIIVSLLHSVGLSEGSDSISQGLAFKSVHVKSIIKEKNRRHRLINFCLFKLSSTEEPVMKGAASTAIAALVNGREAAFSTFLSSVCKDSAKLTIQPDEENSDHEKVNMFDRVWGEDQPLLQAPNNFPFAGSLSKCRNLVLRAVQYAGMKMPSADILASSQSSALFEAIVIALDMSSRIPLPSLSGEDLSSLELLICTLKIHISVLLVRKKDLLFERAFDQMAPVLAEILKTASSQASDILKGESMIVSELLRVVEFISLVASMQSLDLPHSITDYSQDLAEELEKFLEATSCSDVSSPADEYSEEPTRVATVLDLEDDDLEDRIEGQGTTPTSRKRTKTQSPGQSRKRSRRAEISRLGLRNILSAGRLLLAIKPTMRSIRFMTENVLGVDLDRPMEYYDSTLPVDPVIAACLACLISPLLRAEESGTTTGASLLSRLVRMVRKRSSPESGLYLFGYKECERFCLDDGWISLKNVTESDAKELLLTWTNFDPAEARSLSLRPQIRTIATSSLCSSFVGGDETLRSQWQRDYPKLILATMYDSIGCVRRHASFGVAASLAVMASQRKVIESTLRNLPPVTSDQHSFKNWYMKLTSDTSVAVRQSWEDARNSFEFTSLASLALLGGRAIEQSSQMSILLKIIEVAAHRYDLEPACLHLADIFATTAGFGTAEVMLAECLEILVSMWLGKRDSDLSKVPLLFSAPSVLRFMIKNSLFSSTEEKLENVRTHASDMFLIRNLRLFLPRLLTTLSDPKKPDQRLKDLCLLFSHDEVSDDEVSDGEFRKVMGKLLGKGPNIASITAFSLVSKSSQTGNEMDISHFIQYFASDEQAPGLQLKKFVTHTAKYFLQQASLVSSGESSAFYAIAAEHFLDICNRFGDQAADSVFEQVGITFSECCIMSRMWVRPSPVEWLGQKRIQCIRLLWTIACRGQQQIAGTIRIDFLLLLFSELFSGRHSPSFLLNLLELWNDIMRELTVLGQKSKFCCDEGMRGEVRVLFCSLIRLFNLHETELIEQSSRALKAKEKLRRSMCGLSLQSVASNATVSEIDSASAVPEDTHEGGPNDPRTTTLHLLRKIKDSLELIAKDCGIFGLNYESDLRMLVVATPPDAVDGHHPTGFSLDNSLSLETLDPVHDADEYANETPELYTQLVSNKDFSLIAARRPTTELSPHQYLLLRDLKDLFVFLTKNEVGLKRIASNRETLLLRLSELCVGTPQEIRGAATRCIGALQRHDKFESSLPFGATLLVENEYHRDRLEPYLRTKCLRLLLEMVKSPSEISAVIAMETIKALLTTKSPFQKTQLSIIHFCSWQQNFSKARNASLVLETFEVKRIKDDFDRNATWGHWCWDVSFWMSCMDTDFAVWICKLVPAIISCHFVESCKEGGLAEPGKFLSYCQRMSHLESDFAAAVFPLLILRLLQEQQASNEIALTEVQRDTWIGDAKSATTQSVSKCFAAVLDGCSRREDIQDSRAVGLLVDTLDMVRRLEQQNFMSSNGHTRNPPTMKMFRNSAGSSQESTQSQSPEEYGPVAWSGIPFGVGLFINGISLAKACVKVKRMLSAAYYAEHFADIRFGGSTREIATVVDLIKEESYGSFMTADISGFPPTQPYNEISAVIEDAQQYFEVMVNIARALQQRDFLDALLAKLSDVRLMAKTYALGGFERRSQFSPAETLREVDSQISDTSGQNKLLALSCLSEMHLHGTLQASIEGLASRPDDTAMPIDILRDKWFEGCLFGNTLGSFIGSPSDTSHALPASGDSAGFCESILTALQSFAEDDYKIARIHIENARFSTFSTLEDIVTEASMKSDVIDKLNCLNDLEMILEQRIAGKFPDIQWKGDAGRGMIIEPSLADPLLQPERPFSDRVQELVLHHMSTNNGEYRQSATKMLSSFLWQLANETCESSRIGDAQAAFRKLSALHGHDCNRPEFFRVRHLEARILERKGDFSSAIRHASQSLVRLQHYPLDVQNDETKAELLVSCGQWMATYRVDSGEKVLANFLKPGLELAHNIHSTQNPSKDSAWRLTEACIALGDLVFNIYETVTDRIKSPSWKTAGASLKAREIELKEVNAVATHQLKQRKPGATLDPWLRELAMYRQNLTRDVGQIRGERIKIERSIEEFKDLAFKTLVQLLSVADDSYKFMSKFVYRMVALWLSSGSEIEDHLEFDQIPSYRFVPLATQLFSRLSPSGRPLTTLVRRISADHPYHCLAQIVRLSLNEGSSNERDEQKASIANEILNTIKADSQDFLSDLVENYETLITSYNVLANTKTDDLARGGSKKIDFMVAFKDQKMRLDKCLRNRQCIPCILTKPPPIRPNMQYGEGIEDPVGGERIKTFESKFSIADSGITRPKIVVCIGTQGGRYKQLVKGGDDCRGDAVMQQVFHYVNEMFAQEREARAKNLRIVTYNIIPTSPNSGVLEWVENTLPFGDYLVDRGHKKGPSVGAHSKYFPGEWGTSLCRDHLKKAYPDQAKQLKAMKDIYRCHSPAFRFFFVERFGHSAHHWFEAKTKYTRSVAVTSFVGHVLGIGDRHGNNILVHQTTGEVVHIDFGIVFEQGKLLQVPERVPFRLTRNIIDGFGPTGTDGRFTTASYETMNALRQNSGALLTILSSIVADPLYRWSVSSSPKLARKREEILGKASNGSTSTKKRTEGLDDDAAAENNESAEQAVRKVKEKLSGYEDGTAGEQQSTEGQVHLLINTARDINLLSQMYPGWAPWN